MQQYTGKYMTVKKLFFKGNDIPLLDKIIFFTNHFIIIAEDIEGHSHTWCNIDTIERLEGVEAYKAPAEEKKPREPLVWRV